MKNKKYRVKSPHEECNFNAGDYMVALGLAACMVIPLVFLIWIFGVSWPKQPKLEPVQVLTTLPKGVMPNVKGKSNPPDVTPAVPSSGVASNVSDERRGCDPQPESAALGEMGSSTQAGFPPYAPRHNARLEAGSNPASSTNLSSTATCAGSRKPSPRSAGKPIAGRKHRPTLGAAQFTFGKGGDVYEQLKDCGN